MSILEENDRLSAELDQAGGDIDEAARIESVGKRELYRRLSRCAVQRTQTYQRMRIETLVTFFGVPRDVTRRGRSFWQRHAGQLDALFYDLRKNYLAMVRKHHESGRSPDSARLARINALWEQLVAAMRSHGVEC